MFIKCTLGHERKLLHDALMVLSKLHVRQRTYCFISVVIKELVRLDAFGVVDACFVSVSFN